MSAWLYEFGKLAKADTSIDRRMNNKYESIIKLKLGLELPSMVKHEPLSVPAKTSTPGRGAANTTGPQSKATRLMANKLVPRIKLEMNGWGVV